MPQLAIFVFTLLLFIEACQPSTGQPRPLLIPSPQRMEVKGTKIKLEKGVGIGYLSDSLRATAQLLAEYLDIQKDLNPNLKPGSSNELVNLEIRSPKEEKLGNEGYRITTTQNKFRISANTTRGLLWGIQSFRQLVSPFSSRPKESKTTYLELPEVEIEDVPAFPHRGFMLDVSRHFFTKEEVKKVLDHMARYKLNVFHWHLTDDQGWRIEIKSYPKLTQVGAWRVQRYGAFNSSERKPALPDEKPTYGGFYTQEDVKEIVAYAWKRGIEVIPEIDVPGHSLAAIAAYPELCCTKDSTQKVSPGSKFSDWYGNGTFKMHVDNSLNPANEQTYQFLDKVFGEMAQLFPSAYVHIGGDECYKGYWKKDPACKALMAQQNIRHLEDLQGYFMNRVQDILKKKGKKAIAWDEVMEGGMNNDALICFWRGWMANEVLPMAQRGNYKLITCPTSTNYFDYQQGEKTIEPPVYATLRLQDVWKYEPIPKGIEAGKVVGGQANLWTENIQTLRHAEYMMFPRLLALSEILWAHNNKPKWPDFIQKVESHMQQWDKEKINYAHSIYDPIITYKKEKSELFVTMESEVPGLSIHYTLDESMPDAESPVYTKPIKLPSEGALTLRVRAYRSGKPVSHLITHGPDFIKAKR